MRVCSDALGPPPTATATTTPPTLSLATVSRITEALARVTSADLRASAYRDRLAASTPPALVGKRNRYVGYVSIADDPRFTLGAFVLGPHAELPLHDHVGMHVFSTIVAGEASCTSFDWVSPDGTEGTAGGEARFVDNRARLGAGESRMVSPGHGQVHSFVASESGCVMLDVLTPPYKDDDPARACHYFEVRPASAGASDKAFLDRIPDPTDLAIVPLSLDAQP